jgi:hypothetical protein
MVRCKVWMLARFPTLTPMCECVAQVMPTPRQYRTEVWSHQDAH